MPSDSNPYVGPRPFDRREEQLFFGRDHEANGLVSLAIAHPVVLFYSQSGAGKTSLINARLAPLLERRGLEVLPLARVQGPTSEAAPEAVRNFFILQALLSLAGTAAGPEALSDQSLAEALKLRVRPTDVVGLPLPRVVIFDQFEELFLSHPDRWTDRQGFFEQVRDALEDDHLLRVLFAMREDYIAELDPYAGILPEKMRTRFRLERLRDRAALAAVTGPLRGTRRLFATGVAEELVQDLRTVEIQTAAGEVAHVIEQFVEPVQLQVVCQILWEGLQPEDIEITRQHLATSGDVDRVLSDFYEKCLEKALQDVEVREGILRRWFEETLITPIGTRGTVFKGLEETGGIPNAVIDLMEDHQRYYQKVWMT